MSKLNIDDLYQFKKNRAKISMLTAYDAQMAAIQESVGVELILVGDSLGMVFQGNTSTMDVAVDHMVYHVQAVRRGAPNTFIIGDMPKDSYKNVEEGLETAEKLMKAGSDAVKYEGDFPELAHALKEKRIPLMGHLGLLPQTAKAFKVQGKTPEDADRIRQAAYRLVENGAFSIVLECVPESLAKELVEKLPVPIIGIGAGVHCDGQVLVVNDLLNMADSRKPKFVKSYTNLNDIIGAALGQYISEVKEKKFPDYDHTYH